jgi:hypothetical protein
VAAPFLATLRDHGVKAQSVASPRRLVMMFTHHGCITTRFFPTKSHGPLTADDLTPTTLKYLAPYVDKVLMPRGIRAMNEWTSTMVRGQGNDPGSHVGSFLTCQPINPNSNDPFALTDAKQYNPKPVGPSVDHVITQSLSAGGVPLFMRVGNQNGGYQTAISFSAASTNYPGIGVPSQVFSGLTGLFAGGTAMSPDSYRAARGQSVLDIVKDDLDTLERYDMSQSDRNKLEAWKALLNSTMPVARAGCNADFATSLELTKDNVSAAGSSSLGGDVLMQQITDSLDGADIYSNLAALAAVCNTNPVIVLKYPANYTFKGLGLSIEAGALSHRLDSENMTGTCVPNAIEMLLSIDDYYSKKFAHLVDLFNSIDDGDGTLLDSSAAVWLQEVSDGAALNLNNLPIVQVGSLGGYFKTGWAVNVEDGRADLTTGNSEAFCTDDSNDMVNMLTQATGTDPSLANAPINKYYCNLMNALGVKAGADGFAAVDGTAEVTKFGMYDKTEDFIGGGTNPPIIHSPGEFSALRAS